MKRSSTPLSSRDLLLKPGTDSYPGFLCCSKATQDLAKNFRNSQLSESGLEVNPGSIYVNHIQRMYSIKFASNSSSASVTRRTLQPEKLLDACNLKTYRELKSMSIVVVLYYIRS